MSKGRVNPRRKPINSTDIHKAKVEAVRIAWGVFMLALSDVLGFEQQTMTAVWDRINELEQQYVDGKLTRAYLQKTMLDRYGIKVPDDYGGQVRKRVNPTSNQITLADLNNAKRQAIHFSFLCFMHGLGDVCSDLDRDRVRRVWSKMNEDEVEALSGRLSVKMLRNVLLSECGIRLVEDGE